MIAVNERCGVLGSFTAIIQYTVHTSRVRLDDEISTTAAH